MSFSKTTNTRDSPPPFHPPHSWNPFSATCTPLSLARLNTFQISAKPVIPSLSPLLSSPPLLPLSTPSAAHPSAAGCSKTPGVRWVIRETAGRTGLKRLENMLQTLTSHSKRQMHFTLRTHITDTHTALAWVLTQLKTLRWCVDIN